MCVRNNCFRFPSHATPTHTHTHEYSSSKNVLLNPNRCHPTLQKHLNVWCWQHLCATIGLGFVVAERQDWVFVWETRLVSSNADVQLLLSVSCLPGDTKDDVRGDTIPSVQHRCVAIAPNGGCWSRVVSPPAPSIRKRDHAENLGQRE